jgi:hypothetical protein
MAGKKGASGRPRGSYSRFKNPVALCGQHMVSLLALWRAGVLIPVGPDKYLAQPDELGAAAPLKVKHVLAELAIQHVQHVYEGHDLKLPLVEQVVAWAANYRAPSREDFNSL